LPIDRRSKSANSPLLPTQFSSSFRPTLPKPSTSSPIKSSRALPELPDITVYIEALRTRVEQKLLRQIRVRGPFLVRTFEPSIDSLVGQQIHEICRLGKRIAFGFESGSWLVLHLMIAGRLHWKPPGASFAAKSTLAAFDFDDGVLLLSEAGSKHRASLHVHASRADLAQHDRGGLEVLESTLEAFASRLTAKNHTLKRALADPTIFSGIGNAYSDEILHRGKLSPLKQTRSMTSEEISNLHAAVKEVLIEWTELLRAQAKGEFPERVTAFRPEMAVHGKFGKPCPVCNSPVQRIRYADRETNYCARCQCEGRLLADRSLSRLLKDDWPKHLDEL
jgi:formamidopyrimidine-DNA glycosylase